MSRKNPDGDLALAAEAIRPVTNAKAIVAVVLARHGITSSDTAMNLIVNGLEIAGDEEFFLVAAQRHDHEEQRARIDRIARLDAVIDAYHQRFANGTRVRSAEGEFAGYENLYLHRVFDRDLLSVVNDLERLRHIEDVLSQMHEPEPIPNARPTSAKNAGAACILRILTEEITPTIPVWEACGVTADLLIEAGIEDKARSKVQRSLYDMVQRLVR